MKPNEIIQSPRSAVLAVLGCAVLSLGIGQPACADAAWPHAVGVYAQHSGDKVIYWYRLTNNAEQAISSLAIGLNSQNDGNPNNDIYELIEFPSGWNSKFGIPSTSYTAPMGWKVSLATATPNSREHALVWEPVSEKAPRLFPGETLAKISIALDRPDPNCLSGHAVVTFADGTPGKLTVPLERIDKTPPSFSVTLSPDAALVPENAYAVVSASFMIKDDYDRMPEIRLESVTADEPLQADDVRDASIGLDDRYLKLRGSSQNPAGRIYTVTYSATDASGNKSIASASVTVLPAHMPVSSTVTHGSDATP